MTLNSCSLRFCLETFLTKIVVLFLILMLGSCNTVKRVKEDEKLLTKNTVYVNGKKDKSKEIHRLLTQQPNSALLGIPLRLHIYNLAKEHPDSAFYNWLHEKEKREERWKRFLSEKQLDELRDSYTGFNNWLKKTGEAPVVIDNVKTGKSVKRLEGYYSNQGYFNAEASYEIIPGKEKKASIDYYVEKGNPYFIDTISRDIASAPLDSIYLRHRQNSIIKEGQQFNGNDFNAERNRLSALFTNSGVYRFQPNSITFNIERDTIAGHQDYKMPVEVSISNPVERGANNDSLREYPYKIHTIENVNIYVDCIDNDDSLKTVTHENYTLYYKDKLQYRPKAITNSIAIRSGDTYSDTDRALTNRQISNLRTFTYPSIQYRYADSAGALLATHIYLNSRPRFSVGVESSVSHSNIQDFGISFSASVISRNVFRGAETVEIAARGTLGSSKEASNPEDKFFNISEVGADARLNFPRIFFPVNTDSIIPSYMSPTTRISLGTSVQSNIGLDKQLFNSILRYGWEPGLFTRNALELFNIQFIRNVNIDNFFNVYQNTYQRLKDVAVDNGIINANDDFIIPQGAEQFIEDVLGNNIPVPDDDREEVRRINERKTRLTDNNLIVASNFTYTRNNRTGIIDNNFSQFRTKIELAGNMLSAFAKTLKLEKNEDGHYELFKVAYSQYVKTEFDYIKYWTLSEDNVLAFRSFLGIAIPYGNSDNIPFSRSYFAGGANDNRAWEAYALGPGSTGALNDFNEANLKLSFNVEYRFKLVGSFNGALFSDIGNIWNIWDNVEDENATFDSFSSLKDIAVGTGFGIRYDFGFFVLRFDTGFKTYNPAYETGRRWFTDFGFAHAVYNIGINYPF